MTTPEETDKMRHLINRLRDDQPEGPGTARLGCLMDDAANALEALLPPNQVARPEDGPRVAKIAAMIVRGFNLDESDTPDLDIQAATILAGAIDAAVYRVSRPEDGWLKKVEGDLDTFGPCGVAAQDTRRLIAIARAAGGGE